MATNNLTFFVRVLQPSDFRAVKQWQDVLWEIDEKMYYREIYMATKNDLCSAAALVAKNSQTGDESVIGQHIILARK